MKKENGKIEEEDNEDIHILTKEELELLKKASSDIQMLADQNGQIVRVEEIDYIINDVVKHQDKAFKYNRAMEDLNEKVEEVEGFVNNLEERCFVPYDKAAGRYTDEELLKIQRSVVFYLVKQIGVNLLTGKSIMNVSLPIKIFEPNSYLEKIAKDFRYAPHYFNLAKDSIKTIERVKLIAEWLGASIHLEPQMHKPFNPILGETFQGIIGDYDIGLEQISHHPPITAFQLWSTKYDDAPVGDGYLAAEASTGISTIYGYKKGKIRVKFPNGQEIVAHTFPEFEMKGLMKGDRTFDFHGHLKLSDFENDVHVDVIFNPDKKGWFKRMFSSTQKTSFDYYEGVIWDSEHLDFKDHRGTGNEEIEQKHDTQVYHRIDGNINTSLRIDDEEVWNKNYKYLTLQYINNPLPSDCRFRTDLIALLNGDLSKAQEQKNVLEDIQRKDKKLRKNGLKEHNKKKK